MEILGRTVRGDPAENVASEWNSRGNEGGNMDPRGKSKCKDPEVEAWEGADPVRPYRLWS